MTHMTQDSPGPELLGTVRVDARGRVYFKRLASQLPPGALYLVDVERSPETETPGSPSAPRTIRMRLVE